MKLNFDSFVDELSKLAAREVSDADARLALGRHHFATTLGRPTAAMTARAALTNAAVAPIGMLAAKATGAGPKSTKAIGLGLLATGLAGAVAPVVRNRLDVAGEGRTLKRFQAQTSGDAALRAKVEAELAGQ